MFRTGCARVSEMERLFFLFLLLQSLFNNEHTKAIIIIIYYLHQIKYNKKEKKSLQLSKVHFVIWQWKD